MMRCWPAAEERATLAVRPAATPAQQAFRAWGWHRVARTREPGPDAALLDVLITDLPSGRELPPANMDG